MDTDYTVVGITIFIVVGFLGIIGMCLYSDELSRQAHLQCIEKVKDKSATDIRAVCIR